MACCECYLGFEITNDGLGCWKGKAEEGERRRGRDATSTPTLPTTRLLLRLMAFFVCDGIDPLFLKTKPTKKQYRLSKLSCALRTLTNRRQHE